MEKTIDKKNYRLIALRKNADLTQAQLAAKVGADQSAISMIENGTRLPGRELMIRLAKVLGVTVEYLFFEEYYDVTT